jgi:hypothetical protein
MNYFELLETVKRDGYVVVDNFIDKTTVNNSRLEYSGLMRNLEIHPPKEAFSPKQLDLAPWRKQAIGSKTGSGEVYSQILQTTYFSENYPNAPALMSIFRKMIYIRNEMMGMRSVFGGDLGHDEFWNACRLHHYPRGGGHMASHRDTLFPRLQKEFEIPFIQIMVTLTNRGEDFYTGGLC